MEADIYDVLEAILRKANYQKLTLGKPFTKFFYIRRTESIDMCVNMPGLTPPPNITVRVQEEEVHMQAENFSALWIATGHIKFVVNLCYPESLKSFEVFAEAFKNECLDLEQAIKDEMEKLRRDRRKPRKKKR